MPVALMVLVAAACGSDDAQGGVVEPDGSETILLDEFSYEPDEVQLVAGSTVTLTFGNVGAIDHEVMIGSTQAEGGGYTSDLLSRMSPEVIDGHGYEASFDAAADLENVAGGDDHSHDDEAPAEDHHDDDAADTTMPAEDHDDDDAADTTMPAEDHDEAPAGDHDEDGDGHHDGATADHGAHILVEPGGEVTLRLQVPTDASGSWEIGCFLSGHYEAGMLAPLTIVAASA